VRRRGRPAAAGESRPQAALLAGFAIWAIIVLRLALVQLAHAPRLSEYAQRQHVVEVELAAARGTIYDRNMVPLTDNLTVHSACAYPSEIESPSVVARGLAQVLGGSYQAYLSKLKEERQFVWIERQLPPAKAAALEKLDLPGVGLLKESRRVYPHGKTACHVVGFTDVDGRGIAGVEQQMNDVLAGSEARVCYCLDSAGRRTPTPACTRIVPRDGADVVLTIDIRLQDIAMLELERAVREHDAARGMVIIEDPWTGEILAMANWPAFDPNCPSRYSVDSQKNRAITDQFEPGSTFKLITASAALATGAADLTSVYYAGRGSMCFGSFTIRDVSEHGWLDFVHAFAKSSNVCFAQIASSIGPVPLYSLARDYGFGSPTGICLPGEVRGVLREPSEWSGRSVHTIGIGQEIAVTALQLADAYAVVANGGYLMEPQILKSVITADGEVAEEARWGAVRQVIPSDLAGTLRDLLVEVTEEGTGKNGRVTEFAVAGKTGTAQKTVQGVKGFAPGKHVSSFVGIAPARDPEIVCLVVIDEPKGRGLGGDVAAPAFSRIVERIVRGPAREVVLRSGGRETDHPSDGRPGPGGALAAARNASPGTPLATPAGAGEPGERQAVVAADGRISRGPLDAAGLWGQQVVVAATSGNGSGNVTVPDLRGLSIRQARRLASSAGLEFGCDGSGVVRTQTPRPGANVPSGHRVVVTCYPR
jgi:cell division protein FtsI/penicillin-binding protein 2